MAIQFKPLHPIFAAEVSGLDLTQAPTDAQLRSINAAMNQYAVLVFRGQPLTAQQQLAFASAFGPLDIGLKRVFKRPERLEDERLIDISNVDANGQVSRRDSPKNLSNFANQLWHSDSSFMNPRAAYSMLHCLVKPSWGGNTEFADLRHAYDTLDEPTRAEIQGLKAEHYALHTRILLGDDAYTDEQKKTARSCLSAFMRTKSWAGRPQRVECSCKICSSTPPSARTSMCMSGKSAIWSYGITEVPCTGGVAMTSPSAANCAARPSTTPPRPCSERLNLLGRLILTCVQKLIWCE